MARRSSTHPDILKPKLRKMFLLDILSLIQNYCNETNRNSDECSTIVHEFVKNNSDAIDRAVDTMYKDYEDDGELNDLKNPEADWIREYTHNDELGQILNQYII